MTLPLSGILSYGDIRQELRVVSSSNFSIAAEEGVAPYAGKVPLNYYSTYKPNTSAPAAVSEWYGYNVTESQAAPINITGIHNRIYMYVVNLGATSKNYYVDVTATTTGLSGNQNAVINGIWGYPFTAECIYYPTTSQKILDTGNMGPALSSYNTTFYYAAGTATGSLAYFLIQSVQNSSLWPTFSININEIVDITISVCGPASATCGQYYTFTACASSAVDTAIDVDFSWQGDLGGVMSGTITIPPGYSSGTTSVYSSGVNCLGEFASTFDVTSITPSSYVTQSYIPGSTYTGGSCPC